MRVLAVDLGATSVRVATVDLGGETPHVDVVHRWAHAPVEVGDGSLRWDWEALMAEVEKGLAAALDTGPAASIGVDGWGVDYGLVDASGGLVAPPYSYRDRRTAGWRRIADEIGVDRLYEITGIQLMGINTIFQLAEHTPAELEQAASIVLLPDLVVSSLTGQIGAERSNASTTGLLDARRGTWSDELLSAMGIDASLLPPVRSAGERVGTWSGVPVHLVGSHDTASAFLAAPRGSDEGTIVVSTGTWVIVGVERPEPDTSPAANDANFSNESGAFGGYRFLKNVMGFWMLEQCRVGWGDPDLEVLFEEAAEVVDAPVFDARDDRFLAPDDMEEEIRSASKIPSFARRGVVVRSIVESIAAGIAAVVDEIQAVTGVFPRRLSMVGGGARTGILQRALEERTGLEVIAGSSEATALGNGLAQGVALGRFDGVAVARTWLDADV